MHGGAALMRFERVLVTPQGIGAGKCTVNKLVWGTPVGNLRRPVDGKNVPPQAVTDERSRSEFPGRLHYAEIKPRRGELLQIFRSRKKIKDFFQWSPHPLLPFEIIRPHIAMELQRPHCDSKSAAFGWRIAFGPQKYSVSTLTRILNSGKNKPSHVPLEGQHVDTHPVGQRRLCGAAVGGATGRRSAGYCVPSRDSSRCTPRSS